MLEEIAGRPVECEWLPVPSTVATTADPARVAAIRSEIAPGKLQRVVAHFGTFGGWIPEELTNAGIIGFVGEYLGARVWLRRDFSYADETLALCHELLHVCLHPLIGNRPLGFTEAMYAREERIVNIASAQFAAQLNLGDYVDFAARFTLDYPADHVDPVEQGEADQLVEEVIATVNALTPQAHDGYYEQLKQEHEATLESPSGGGFAASTRLATFISRALADLLS